MMMILLVCESHWSAFYRLALFGKGRATLGLSQPQPQFQPGLGLEFYLDSSRKCSASFISYIK